MIVFIVQKGELRIRKSNDLPKVMQLGGRRVIVLAQLSDPTLIPQGWLPSPLCPGTW